MAQNLKRVYEWFKASTFIMRLGFRPDMKITSHKAVASLISVLTAPGYILFWFHPVFQIHRMWATSAEI